MPIYNGLSTKNKKDIIINDVPMQKVYVGNRLVWKKASPFTLVKLGLLYNGFCAIDPRGFTSSDEWNVSGSQYEPTSDISLLKTFCEGSSAKLKDSGTEYWLTPNTGATNEYGFNARPAGFRFVTATDQNYTTILHNFSGLGEQFVLGEKYIYEGTLYWSGQTYFYYDSELFGHASGFDNTIGVSVRLCRNTTPLTHGQTGVYVGNDGKRYRTICIGTQEWLADNLAETKFRDGSLIPEITGNADWATSTSAGFCAPDNDWNKV